MTNKAKPEKSSHLTKKERKRLQDIISRKEKKEKRRELLESLSHLKASSELSHLLLSSTSLTKPPVPRQPAPPAPCPINPLHHRPPSRPLSPPSSSPNTSDFSSDCPSDCPSPPAPPTSLPRPSLIPEDNTLLVHVERDPRIQTSRFKLPILSEESTIMSALSAHDVVIICGETGSGKSTQVPQFLYEAGYGRDKSIVVTQPRRVAAIALSERVGYELGLPERVGYAIRYETNVGEETRVRFVTDGVLLKELEKDLLLGRYSVVVVDEAHERSINSDILIGFASRVVDYRRKTGHPLKLVVMSATMNVDQFLPIFASPPPVLQISARQFPITTMFCRTTPEDYLTAAYHKVLQIHRRLPRGTILVFVTGRDQVNKLCSMLRGDDGGDDPLRVLPFYSKLPQREQRRVFEEHVEGRLCVVSTNVAETSLTIPNVKYVVDTGKEKRRYVDKTSGVGQYRVGWISQASAQQRAGRAGRVSEGYCYRLYSSAVYDDFAKFTPPEITQVSIEGVVLLLKKMEVSVITDFPFPTPPSVEAVKAAEDLLGRIGALEGGAITRLGRAVSEFPVHPRMGKVLVHSGRNGVWLWGVALVAGMGVAELVMGHQGDEVKKARRALVGGSLLGDLMLVIRIMETIGTAPVEEVARTYGLRLKALVEAVKLRDQLRRIGGTGGGSEGVEVMSQLVMSAFPDHIARRAATGAYECPSVSGKLHIHPDSLVADSKPDYVLFTSVEDSGKLYMMGVCAVDPIHLPHCAESMCHFSEVLEDPPPRYVDGDVLCHRRCRFGGLSWDLGRVETTYPPSLQRICHFARFFLEGVVSPPLAKYRSILLGNPSMLTTCYSSLQRKAHNLISAFCTAKVDGVSALRAAWATDPYYLLDHYLEYIPLSLREEVTALWTSLIHSL